VTQVWNIGSAIWAFSRQTISLAQDSPIYAYTQCGELHTNVSRDVLEDFDFSTGSPQRGWHGFVSPTPDRFGLKKFQRPAAALDNADRDPGLDLISNSGAISILAVDAAN
ncbi:MAG: hypothetical protein AAF961_17950, partial [Planctomycetota bacterium]